MSVNTERKALSIKIDRANEAPKQQSIVTQDDSDEDNMPLKRNESIEIERLTAPSAGSDAGLTVPRVRTPSVNRQLSVLSLGGYEKIETGVSLTWNNLTYKVGKEDNQKTILNNISGYIGPGNVLVILGPSGSGKTSLLSILSGTRAHTSGDICYQGQKKTITKTSEDIMGFHGNASYVAQDDILQGSLTVEETLRFAAQLKISDPEVDKESQINAIIRYLGLENARSTLVGSAFIKGLSGGQKRRLSIGVELVTQPGILFLDEVTSGLDATSAYKLLRLISKLAELGHSIVMTLHQPTSRIFELMCKHDHYLCILERGNMSYFGYAKDSINFFDSIGYRVPPFNNATDYFLDLVNRDFDKDENNNNNTNTNLSKQRSSGLINTKNKNNNDKNNKNNVSNNNNNGNNKQNKLATADIINQAFATNYLPNIQNEINNINSSNINKSIPKFPGNNKLKQFFILCKRNTLNLLRNPGIFWLRLVLYCSLCLSLGSLYWNIDNKEENTQDRVNLLFFCLSFFSFMSISAMPAFVEERGVYMRERMNNHYSTISYVLADFLSSIPWVFFLSVACSSVIYPMAQLRWGWDYYLIFLLTFFITLLVSENMMVMISAMSSLFMVGLAAGSGILGLFMTLGGFVIRKGNIPDGWKWAHYGISFHTWAFQIFMHNDLHNNNNVDLPNGNGNKILKEYQMNNVDVPFAFFVLCMMILFYRVAFYLLLRLKNRRQR